MENLYFVPAHLSLILVGLCPLCILDHQNSPILPRLPACTVKSDKCVQLFSRLLNLPSNS